jgi:hypothetical protein
MAPDAMDIPNLLQSAYQKLWALITENRIALPRRFLPYDFPSQSGDPIYALQENEFTRELVNSINQFSFRLDRLTLWEEVISGYCEEQALELRLEFTEPLVY